MCHDITAELLTVIRQYGPMEEADIATRLPEFSFSNLRSLQLEGLIYSVDRSQGYSRDGWLLTSDGLDLLVRYRAAAEREQPVPKVQSQEPTKTQPTVASPQPEELPLGPTLAEWLAHGNRKESWPPKGYRPNHGDKPN